MAEGNNRVRVFKSDGCSMWPDGNYRSCCDEHDLRYFYGGCAKERAIADRMLRECVIKVHSRWMGWLMWVGVRIGGHPWLPFPRWRWGYSCRWPKSDVQKKSYYR